MHTTVSVHLVQLFQLAAEEWKRNGQQLCTCNTSKHTLQVRRRR